jgi:hypothetical protein
MITTHKFKGSWFVVAMIAAIVIGELVALKLSAAFDFHVNPVTVAFASAGLVALVASVVFDDWKVE